MNSKLEWTVKEASQIIQDHLEASIDPDTGEISEEAIGKLSILELDLERRIGACSSAYRQLNDRAKAFKAEAKHFTDKARTLENAAERMRKAVHEEMDVLGTTKIAGPWGGATIQKGAPSCVITGDVPYEYLVQPDPVPDKKMIIQDLKNGEVLDFAELQSKTHLRFR
jgi:hypothetical protein